MKYVEMWSWWVNSDIFQTHEGTRNKSIFILFLSHLRTLNGTWCWIDIIRYLGRVDKNNFPIDLDDFYFVPHLFSFKIVIYNRKTSARNSFNDYIINFIRDVNCLGNNPNYGKFSSIFFIFFFWKFHTTQIESLRNTIITFILLSAGVIPRTKCLYRWNTPYTFFFFLTIFKYVFFERLTSTCLIFTRDYKNWY